MWWWLIGCEPPAPVTPPTESDAPVTAVSRIEVLPQAPCVGDRSSEPPLSFLEDESWTAQHHSDGPSRFMIGGGVGVADIDGDGFNDVLLPKNGGVSLWLGTGTQQLGPLISLASTGQYTAAVPVDYDGDGDLDIYLSRYDGPDQLLQNDGLQGFHDVAEEAGILVQDHGIGSSWADMDGDGDLDLLAMTHGNWLVEESTVSRIFEAQGDGSFIDITDEHFHDDQGLGHTLAGGFIDLDGDLLPEIYLVNDYGWILPNQMFWNRPEGFVPAEPMRGLDRRMCGMGLAVADVDGDHAPDLFHSAWLELRLLATAGTDFWIDFTSPAGILIQEDLQRHVAWGADFGDLDNDGDDDLWLGFGAIPANIDNPAQQPDALYLRDGPRFVERSFFWGVADPRRTRGGLLVDIDGDGWIDLIKRNKDVATQLAWGTCGQANWLEIQLRDQGPNTRAIGARVRLIDGQFDKVNWIRAGGRSLSSGGPPELHFGLAQRDLVDVEVTWPDGEVELFPGIAANQRLRIHR